MTDWMNKYGSGPAPITPRDEIIRLQQEEEASLLRAERAMRSVTFFKTLCCDKKISTDKGAEPMIDSQSNAIW